MSTNIISIDPLKDARWDDFVARHPQARFPHSAAWIDVLQRSYGYIGMHLAYESDGRLEGILPLFLVSSRFTGRRLVSLPFSGPVGPLGTRDEVVPALVDKAMRITSEAGLSQPQNPE